jgi:2-polyprenyl-3-methyl-5-hydroxy-6-metoxy-1,4-benzoquinol methylase
VQAGRHECVCGVAMPAAPVEYVVGSIRDDAIIDLAVLAELRLGAQVQVEVAAVAAPRGRRSPCLVTEADARGLYAIPSAPMAAGPGYYANDRADVIALLPRPVARVLDVGCGAGGTAAGLREAGASEIVGIEIMPSAAERAQAVLDEVHVSAVEDALEDLEGPFDTFLCLDVLEHLVDPGHVLARLRDLAAPDATLQISVPNARHFSLVWDLLVRGTFGYTDWGHRDRTHLRWFTRRDLTALVTAAGWRVVRTSVPPLGRSARLHKQTRGWSSEFLVAQIYLTARAT